MDHDEASAELARKPWERGAFLLAVGSDETLPELLACRMRAAARSADATAMAAALRGLGLDGWEDSSEYENAPHDPERAAAGAMDGTHGEQPSSASDDDSMDGVLRPSARPLLALPG